MAGYSVFFRKSVEKDFSRIPDRDLHRIMERIGLPTDDPRPPGCEKLSARERYRIRQGKYRILYSIAGCRTHDLGHQGQTSQGGVSLRCSGAVKIFQFPKIVANRWSFTKHRFWFINVQLDRAEAKKVPRSGDWCNLSERFGMRPLQS
uniref:mRNA-degrading endonuclease RelE, toxin component of the RelBE toxin-antitoxin system n=1 Tax=Candidatus Kentrum sp. FW TaxID=2126338 RepID=A0A450TQ37_9GAMM|nr:MAG: mRNA-degrading endonuclease RelE, toxin component of the RelBE toxin-antitoxin system [Candidatus Kentron sp. FW]